MPEGYEEAEERATNLTSGFFPVVDEDEGGEDGEDGLEVDHGEVTHAGPAKSAMSTRPKRKTAAKARASTSRRRRRPNVPSSSEEEDEDEDDEEEEDSDEYE